MLTALPAPARGGGARRSDGVGVALPVDALVRGREDVVDLAERSDGLVEVQAERGEVVDRGLRHAPPCTDGDYSEAARNVPSSLVVGEGGARSQRGWVRLGMGCGRAITRQYKKVTLAPIHKTVRSHSLLASLPSSTGVRTLLAGISHTDKTHKLKTLQPRREPLRKQ